MGIQTGDHTTSYRHTGTILQGRSGDVIVAGNGLNLPQWSRERIVQKASEPPARSLAPTVLRVVVMSSTFPVDLFLFKSSACLSVEVI